MANALYDLGRESFLKGTLDYDTSNIKLHLIDAADYVVNLVTDQFEDIIAAAAEVATSANFASKTTTLGVADAADIVLSTVTGDPSEALAIFEDTGTPATSQLIAYIDTATGLPVTPNGGDITVQWDAGANRIFKL